jgi:F-type H+-transporting ATPase subunit b
MQIISTIGLITINETVFIELISFLIFLFIINRIMFRPLQSIITERENHIAELSGGITQSRNQLTKMEEQVRSQELSALREANQHKQNREADATQQAKSILETSRKEILAIKQESQELINRQVAIAREEIKNESQKLAVAIMEKVLDRRLAQ